jgi:DNA-binding XRE family transcriptional regulator
VPRVGPKKRKDWRSEARSAPEVVEACKRLGARVRELREGRADLTQEKLAESARLAWKHVQDIEYGRTNPTIATLVALARALKVSVRDLVDTI